MFEIIAGILFFTLYFIFMIPALFISIDAAIKQIKRMHK